MQVIESRYIGKSEATEKLYKLEEAATKAVRAAAEELKQVLQNELGEEVDIYEVAIPETLATICQSFSSSLVVAIREKS